MKPEFVACEVSNEYSVQYNFVHAHTDLIKTITACKKVQALELGKILQYRNYGDIPDKQLSSIGFSALQIKKLNAAISLGAGLERGLQKPVSLQQIMDDPSIAAQPFMALFGSSSIENFGVMALDIKHRILHIETISKGTETEVLANVRNIIGYVLRYGGTRFIVAHNHPSGSTEPSPEDIAITQQLLDASKIMELPMLDHLIVTRKGYNSLRQSTALWR